MMKRVLVFLLAGLVIISASAAYAQRAGMGFGGERNPNLRIVRGTVDSINAEVVAVSVKEILVPRDGPLSDPPKTLKIAINDDTRFLTGRDRNAKANEFKKGDDVILITSYEGGEYSLRAIMSLKAAEAMRRQLGEKMRERRNGDEPRSRDRQGMRGGQGRSEDSPFGPRGEGRPGPGFGQQAMERMRENPPLFAATFDGIDGDMVKVTITGVIKPDPDGDKPKVEALPEKKQIKVSINDRTRFFHGGEKAAIREFQRGEKVVIIVPRKGRDGGEPMLMLMADEKSAQKLRVLMRDRMEVRRERRGGQDGNDRPKRRGRN